MKKIKAILLIFTAGICLSSCTNWLNLKPFDQTLDEELYGTKRGTNMALNGLYLSMADASLYGKNLSYYTVELLGQRYNFQKVTNVTNLEMADLPYFDYSHKDVASHLDKIFAKAYNVIRDANYYIKQVEKSKVVTGDEKNILLGEGYAIRAFLHFDMLRLYGEPPVLSLKGRGVPYYTEATNIWESILENGKVIELILKDIETALKLLEKDPILTEGVILKSEEYDFFNPYRNRRLNYLAVKALKARVLFYAGDAKSVTQAGTIAVELIESEAFKKAFPWETTLASKDSPEYNVFSHEVIFGIHVQSMYDDWDKWFNTSVKYNFGILPTTVAFLNYMFHSKSGDYTGSNDIRVSHWRESIISSSTLLSSKFSRPEATGPQHLLYFQPLMRKSEIYLIAAEVFQDTKYINEIRAHRGMNSLEDVYVGEFVLQDEIRMEFMKDFVSEGQLFYYYKRRAETSILGRLGTIITVSDPKVSYTPPMPKTETEV